MLILLVSLAICAWFVIGMVVSYRREQKRREAAMNAWDSRYGAIKQAEIRELCYPTSGSGEYRGEQRQ